MGWLREIARDHREIERDMNSARFVWAGTEFPCSVGTAEDRISLDEGGGSVVDRTFAVHVRARNTEGEPAWDWTNGGGPQEGDDVTVVLRDGVGAWAKIVMSKTGKVGEITQIHGQLLRIPINDVTR